MALSPYRNSRKRLWRWPNAFSSPPPNGMWRARILPELEEQLETSRIVGSTHLRTPTSLDEALTEQPDQKTQKKKKRKRRRHAPKPAVGNRTQRRIKPFRHLRQVKDRATPCESGCARWNSKPRNNTSPGMQQRVNPSDGTSTRTRVAPHAATGVRSVYTVE